MAGNNMESLLLGGDDSSSGESDSETVPVPASSSVAAAVAVATTTTTTTTAGAPTPVRTGVTATSTPPSAVTTTTTTALTATSTTADATHPIPTSMSQSEMQQRLKSMYSPATKATTAGGSGGSAPPVAPLPSSATATRPSHSSAATTVSVNNNNNSSSALRPVPPTVATAPGMMGAPVPAPTNPKQQHHSSGIRHSHVPPRVSGVSHAVPNDPQQQQQRSSSGSSLLPTGVQQQQQHQQHNSRTMNSLSHSSSQPRAAVPHQAPHRSSGGGLPPQQQQQQPVVRRTSHGQSQPQQSMAGRGGAPNGMPPPPAQSLASSSSSQSRTGYTGQPPQLPPPPQHQQQQGMPPGTSGTSSSSSSAHAAAMERDRALKKEKEKFLIFTRVLMKYLEQKDPPLHVKVKAIIKDCAERNRKKEPGYESVTASMKIQLKRVVNDGYWKRAEAYLDHFLKEKANAGSQSAMLMSGSSTNQGAIPSSTGSSSVSIDAAKRRALEMQRQQQAAGGSRMPSQEAMQTSQTNLRDDMAKNRQGMTGLSSSAPRPGGPLKIMPTSTIAAKGKAAVAKSRPKGASTPTGQQYRKTSLSSIGGSDGMTLSNGTGTGISLHSSRDYNDLMEQIDHATNVDWTTAGSIMGDETRLSITEEQRRLIYESRTTANAGTMPPDDNSGPPAFPIAGWSQRNVVSSRVAWSRLRRGQKQLEPTANPTVAGGLLGMTAIPGQSTITMEDEVAVVAAKEVDAVWYNEEKAEEDEALALLSEGAEIYIRSVLEKALHCARQRQNLDGIRLWHQQYAHNDAEKPPLSLRLGCDVGRQVAQSIGNAAATCKRMEEALERQSDVPDRLRAINEDTMKTANSMSDLALRPKLSKAIREAEAEGKRNFDVFDGKNAHEPPFGRVPKMAKLEVVDFQTGMNFVRPGRRHRASTLSSSFFY